MLRPDQYDRAARNADRIGCPGYAAELREKRDRAAEVFNTELTPEGEQYVIPGAERNASPTGPKQHDLFG